MSQILTPPPRSTPFILADALHAIDRGTSPSARVRAAVDALQSFGFDRVLITLRDASMNITLTVSSETSEHGDDVGHPLQALPGAAWRRLLAHLDRYRVDDLLLLDGSDAWVSREFFGADPSPRGNGLMWLPTDLVLALLYGAEQELLGTIKLASPRDGRRPSGAKRRDISCLVRHLAARIAYDALHTLAQQRAERLQRLQEAGAALARSLDESEIMRELCRQALRATRADGATIGIPDLDNDILTTAVRTLRGAERPRQPVRLGDGIVAEVARSGQPVRFGDRDADRAREKAGIAPLLSTYDVVGDASPASSVLSVPLLSGIHLVGVLSVFAASREVFSAEDQEVMATMASQAATAIANARRYAESERERRQTEALADVARAVGESLRLGEVLRLILRHSVALLGAEGACIALKQDDYLNIVAAVGAADVLAGVHVPVAGSLLGRATTMNELVVSNDFSNDPFANRSVLRLAPIQRAVIVPLVTGRGTIGAIAVINREQPFLADDARVLQRLADHVAVAIVNARLFEEIERATREWKVAFDSIASGMVVLEENQAVRRCNSRAAELCGVPIASLLGQAFASALLGDGASDNAIALTSLIQRSVAAGTVTRHSVRDDARGRLYELLAAPHPDGGCVLTFDDVTHARQLAERHQRVLETVSDAIVITGLDGRIAFANAAAHELFERPVLVGLLSTELTAEDSLAEVQERERCAQDGVTQRYECRVLTASGTLRHVAICTAPLSELGQITGSVACLRDITEQRTGAIALADSQDLYARLVESAMDGIFTIDAEGCFTSVNQGFLMATGCTRDELIGASYTHMLDPRDHVDAAGLLATIFAGGRQRMQIRYRGANGSLRVGVINTSPVERDGRIVGGLGVVRDTTDEEVLRESNAQQSRLAAVGQLLSGVANELNNPLTSLLAVAELEASSPTLVDADRQVIGQILDEARRASRIVTALLESASDRGRERTILDVNRVVRGALELHGFSLRRRNISVVTSLAAANISVQGDGAQLRQLLINLLTNAEDALEGVPGEKEIRIATCVVGNAVVLAVSDSGPGIADAHVQSVFEPMFSTRAERGGRGFGLTISRTIAREHGGQLNVTSSSSAGATLTLTLPIATYEAAAIDVTPSRTIRGVDTCTILLVEDEATLRSAMSRYLTRAGYVVHLAAGGHEALAQLTEQRYDVVLLDLRMDDLPGDEVYRELERRSPAQAARVLFITGDMHSTSAAEFVRTTGRSVLPKPFELSELGQKVAELLAVFAP